MQKVAGETEASTPANWVKLDCAQLSVPWWRAGACASGFDPAVQIMPSKVTSVKGNVKVTTAC